MPEEETYEGSVVLRENGKVVGQTRGRRKPVERRGRFSTAVQGDQAVDPAAIRKASQALITADGHTMTEDEANARALELISDAAVRLEKHSRIVRKPRSVFSVGAALAAQLEKFKNRGNG